jgi:hypothetical protein
MLTLMVIVILVVWSVSLVGMIGLYRNAMTTLQSVTATPDLPHDPEPGPRPPLQAAAE